MTARQCLPTLIALLSLCVGCGTQELVCLDADQLHYSAGAEDELPDGPDCFDVFPSGEIAVNDPLARRIVVFTPTGRFRAAWNTGFGVDRLRILDAQTLVVRRAGSSDAWTVRAEGRPAPAPPALLDQAPGATPRVQFRSRQERLAGFFPASVDGRFVVLEIATASAPIGIRRVLRKYGASGEAVWEESLDTPPGSAILVRGPRVLQMTFAAGNTCLLSRKAPVL